MLMAYKVQIPFHYATLESAHGWVCFFFKQAKPIGINLFVMRRFAAITNIIIHPG
jgi:hypothetical protein